MRLRFVQVCIYTLVGAYLFSHLGCGDRLLTLQTITETFQQEGEVKVDILFVFDNSTSLREEADLVEQGADEFVNALVGTATDFKLAATTMNLRTQSDNANDVEEIAGRFLSPDGVPNVLTSSQDADDVISSFRQIVDFIYNEPSVSDLISGRGCEAGIAAALLALSSNLNPGFLRADAATAIIFVTDEDAAGVVGVPQDIDICLGSTGVFNNLSVEIEVPRTVDEYLAEYRTLLDTFSLNGILTLPGDTESCESEVANPEETSEKFSEAIEQESAEQVAGFQASICTTNYADFLDDLGLQIAALTSKFTLEFPADPDTLVVTINGTQVDESGFAYNSVDTSVTFTAPPGINATVVIEYQVDTALITLVN